MYQLPTLTYSYEAISDTYGRITSINMANIDGIIVWVT